MKSSKKNIEQLNRIITLLRKGIITPKNLASNTGLSVRQIYRYLDLGLELGALYSPARSVYYPSDIQVISFKEYANKNTRDVNMWMSQSIQHNKTQQVNKNFDLLNLDRTRDKRTKEEIFEDQEEDDTEVESESRKTQLKSLRELVIRILGICQLPYGTRDLQYAVNALDGCAWWQINESNIMDYTAETSRRMSERLECDPAAVKTNAIGYFFGIYRNVISADTRHINNLLKQNYMDYVTNFAQVAAGAEETASAVERNYYDDAPVFVPGDSEDIQEKISHEGTSVLLKWKKARELLNEMIAELKLYGPRYIEMSILATLNCLEEEQISPQKVEAALNDVMIHDKQSACYLIRQIKYQNTLKVLEELDKHYERSIMRKNVGPDTDGKSKDKYEKLYQLFPDS